MNIDFSNQAWQDYLFWQENDKKTLKKINHLIKYIGRNHYEGLGKPEALKGSLSGYWSRHIDECHRIVYRIDNEKIIIVQCRSHYGGK